MDALTFRCKTCDIALTAPLQRLADFTRLSEVEDTDHVPVGFYWLAPTADEDGGYYTEAAGRYLVNLRDVVNTRRHTNSGRTQGCCGLDGCDGPNILCLNGHEIGTERSDCWMAHSLAFNPDNVKAG